MTTQSLVLSLEDILDYLDMQEYDEQLDAVYPNYEKGDIILWPKLVLELTSSKLREQHFSSTAGTKDIIYKARVLFDAPKEGAPYNYQYLKIPNETEWVLRNNPNARIIFRVFRKVGS